jgi:hypothetical protein
MKLCVGFAEAQEAYRKVDRNGDGILEFAQSLRGDNSLLETKSGSGDLALIDRDFAVAEGTPGVKTARNGYRFKVLKGQGERADGGKRSYIENGHMIGGYALLAYPAEYGITGRRCFIINRAGRIYGRDLGAETHDLVRHTDLFDPDPAWLPAEVGLDEKGNLVENTPGVPVSSLARYLAKPSGKAVMSVLEKVDLGLWPDEGFFARFRHPNGAITVLADDGIYSRTELPPPGPATSGGLSPAVLFAGSSIIAVFAVPALTQPEKK